MFSVRQLVTQIFQLKGPSVGYGNPGSLYQYQMGYVYPVPYTVMGPTNNSASTGDSVSDLTLSDTNVMYVPFTVAHSNAYIRKATIITGAPYSLTTQVSVAIYNNTGGGRVGSLIGVSENTPSVAFVGYSATGCYPVTFSFNTVGVASQLSYLGIKSSQNLTAQQPAGYEYMWAEVQSFDTGFELVPTAPIPGVVAPRVIIEYTPVLSSTIPSYTTTKYLPAAELVEIGVAALNDALSNFPLPVRTVYASLNSNTTGGTIGLPPYETVERIEVFKNTEAWKEVSHYTIKPTQFTLLVEVEQAGALRVYTRRTADYLPHDHTITYVCCTNGGWDFIAYRNYAYGWQDWPKDGYLEVTLDANTLGFPSRREVVQYTYASTDTGNHPYWDGPDWPRTIFHVPANGHVEGAYFPYSSGDTEVVAFTASYVLSATQEALAPMLLAAQAALYRYFLKDRTLYDRYTGIASSQSMKLEELLMVIGTLEARASSLYRANVKRIATPQPAYSGRRSRIKR